MLGFGYACVKPFWCQVYDHDTMSFDTPPLPNLDIKNPNAMQDLEHMPPEQLADSILRKEQRIAELMVEIKTILVGAGQ